MKYNILKRFFIIPIMVISLSGCLLYGNYENGTVVAYANPAVVALDWFVQAMGQLGYSFVSSESAKNASKSFSNYLQNEVDTFVNETAPALVDVAVDNKDLHISTAKADMAMWNNVFNKGQKINEAKFNSLQYKDLQMVTENSVATGSYSALTVFTRGWLAQLEKDGHEPIWLTSSVGTNSQIKVTPLMENTSWYCSLKSDSFIYTVMKYINSNDYNYVNGQIDLFLNSLSNAEKDKLNSFGSRFYISSTYKYNEKLFIGVYDIPENLSSIKFKYSEIYFDNSEKLSPPHVWHDCGEVFQPPIGRCSTVSDNGIYTTWHRANAQYGDIQSICVPVGCSDISIDILSDGVGPVYNIDNLDSELSSSVIEPVQFDITKIADIDLAAADSIPLDIDDTQVVPNTATDIIDKVAVGDIANAVTDIDTAVDDTLSESDTISDVVPVPEAGDYAVDLTSFFPFCIPFDIYNLLQCFNASPQAPVIHWEFTNFGKTESIDIDLSRFNSIASIMRILETIAFCVGLGLVTNKLIKH